MNLKWLYDLVKLASLFGLLVAAPYLSAHSLSGKTIQICEDDAQWPPYSFYKIQNTQPSKEIIGYAIDVIHAIFTKQNISYAVTFLPWKRCLEELKHGDSFQMALNASFSQYRQKTYLLSKPYYSTQKHYYYSERKYPDELVIENIQQLKQYQLGGIRGHSFESYGISNALITQRTKGYVELINMLNAGRFDIFLGEHEIISGQANINPQISLEKPLVFVALNNLKRNDFYMLISRGPSYAVKLKALLDKGIGELHDSGQSEQFLKKYIKGTAIN